MGDCLKIELAGIASVAWKVGDRVWMESLDKEDRIADLHITRIDPLTNQEWRAMTETETAYELEREGRQRKPATEPLPECETGSVEQMLKRAVWWGKQIEELSRSKEMGLPLLPKWQAMNVSALLASYGVLMSNILEKMERATPPELEEWPWDKCVGMHMQCPYCGDVVLVTTKLEPTADRRVAKGS